MTELKVIKETLVHKDHKVFREFKGKLGLLDLRVILVLKGLKDLKVELGLLGLRDLKDYRVFKVELGLLGLKGLRAISV